MENHRMLSTPAAAAVGSSGRIRWCRRSPCGGDSTPSTRPASCARQISSRSRGNATPCSVAKASTRRTCQCGESSVAKAVWRCGTRRPRTQAAQAEDRPECAARRREPAARPGERTTHIETSSDGGRSERPQKTLRDPGAPAAAQRLRNRATKAVEELTPSVGSRRVRSHRCAAAGIAARL